VLGRERYLTLPGNDGEHNLGRSAKVELVLLKQFWRRAVTRAVVRGKEILLRLQAQINDGRGCIMAPDKHNSDSYDEMAHEAEYRGWLTKVCQNG
jgi:hypothetical protein